MKKEDFNLFGLQVEPPDNPGTWIGKIWRAKISAILTCLLKPIFIIPIDNGNGLPMPQNAVVTMGKGGYTVVFPALAGAGATGSGSSTVPFSGIGAPSASTLSASVGYLAGPTPSLYVDMTPGNESVYVCKTAGSNRTSVWAKISGGSGGSTLLQYSFTADAGDYILCSNGSINIPILKSPKLRTSIASETIFGNTYSYSYSSAGSPLFYTRTASLAGVTEQQVIIPQFLTNDLIYATTCAQNLLGALQTCLSVSIASGGSGVTGGTYRVNGGASVGGTTNAVLISITTAGGVAVSASIVGNGQTASNGLYSALPSNPASLVGVPATVQPTLNLTWSPQLLDMNINGRAWAS